MTEKPEKNLFHATNRQSIRVMVSAEPSMALQNQSVFIVKDLKATQKTTRTIFKKNNYTL